MYYTREQHKRFLDKELTAISEAYLKLLESKAISLLSSNEVYITKFVKMDFKKQDEGKADRNVLGSGQLLLQFKKDKGIPRKNEYFTAVILEGEMCLPKNWDDITWGKLRSYQHEYSEIHCVWQGKTDEKGFLLCGFSGVSMEMAQFLEKKEGCVIVLGPQEPPMEYYQNLIKIVTNNSQEMIAKEILDFSQKSLNWQPKMINSNKNQIADLLSSLENDTELIIQGPPGTGKTFLMAELVATLLRQKKSVLVTAMTNKALMELIEKDSLKDFLSENKVMKTNVSSDEMAICGDLCPITSKEITCMPGVVTLSTFYNSSGWATFCYEETPFDYVIMDEASQALLGMIAACKNLAKKIIWIGDQNQMQPIVHLSDETLNRNDYRLLVNGFQTLCENFEYESYILSETHRLLPKAASLTSTFYHTPLISVAEFKYKFGNSGKEYLPPEGGTSIILRNMPIGEKADINYCRLAIEIVRDLLESDSNLRIAILTKFRETVRMLQNCFISEIGNNNVLIDTVERVQGMTCDVCLYYIPKTMMQMSLDKPLFNVATSRAKQVTIIIADTSIMNTTCNKDVQTYLSCISTVISPQQKITFGKIIENNGKNIHIKGKIDLSKLETNKQKSVKSDTKKNIYIIDTNIFVKYPDIISKIDSDCQIVLSAKVIDELDRLKIKLDSQGKKNVEMALKHINRAMDRSNVSMELSDTQLLPDDFDKTSPDNNILTVAIKFKEENPILLTSDNGLQIKAKGMSIKTISLKDFLK